MSIQRVIINQVLRFQVKRRFRKKPDVFELRALMDEMTPLLPAPPKDIAIEQLTLGGIPVEKLSTPGTNNGAAFFYIHGGGWVAGSPVSHRPLTWRLAKKLGIPVYAVDYRLAPEHFFPAGLDDCIAAYRGLLAQGVPASSIVVGGDSAGGNLTLALALRLKAEGVALPTALVCLSPATDLTFGGKSVHANAKADSLFVPEMMHTVEARYCPGADRTNPFISPLFGDVAGLPPTLFQVGNTEVLLDDSTRMAEKMKAAGVAVTLDVWPKVWHVWQVMADRLPEGEQAIDKIVAFAKTNLKTAGSRAETSLTNESKPMIKVHHLNNSRSQRILWLLEELGLPYEIVKYQRDAVTNLAPPELKNIHPLGKSPVVTDGNQVIAESGAIIELLVKKYGKGKLAPAEGTPAYDKYIEWLHFAEGSAMLPLMLALYTSRLGDAAAPLGPRITSEIANHLSYMNNSIEKGGYLLGKEFSAADIQNSFTLEAAKVRGFLKDYPNLLDLVDRLQARPAYKRALEKGGPYAFA
jgi:glutathione S-transferase